MDLITLYKNGSKNLIEWRKINSFTTMKTIQQEQYSKLSRALYNLEDILACMGVKEFSLSRDRHNLKMDTNAEDIDTDLLISFCKNIEQLHDTKFGHNHSAIAC